MALKSSRAWQIITEVRSCNTLYIGSPESPATEEEAIEKLTALLTELDDYEACEELAMFCEDICQIMDELQGVINQRGK